MNIIVRIKYNSLSWTACYDNNYKVYKLEKDRIA